MNSRPGTATEFRNAISDERDFLNIFLNTFFEYKEK